MTGWQWIIGIVLIAHGIGHVQGLMHFFGIGSDTWHGRSWLLDGILGEAPARILGAALWSATAAAFVVAGLGVFEIGTEAWRGLAAIAAVVSLATLALFWNGLAMIFNKIGAIAVNLVVVWGAFIADWPGADLFT